MTLVHERFTEFAGSEAVVAELAGIWPHAPIVTPLLRAGVLSPDLQRRTRSTPLSRLLRGSTYAHLLPVLPTAMRHLDVGDSDLVIASHHAFANQIVHSTDAPVVSYVHSPARWVWDPAMRNGEVGGRAGALGLRVFANMYKESDKRAAARVHTLIANSRAVAERIGRWWDREALVVHPPVDTEFYRPDPTVRREDFFLLAGRLVAYKRPDLAISAARAAGQRLVVAGDGRAMDDLAKLAGPTTTLLGRVSNDELANLYRRCTALLMPGEEDFGIIPVEAQACGAPVIALQSGGALDYVEPGVTGMLIPPQDSATHELSAWAEALKNFSDSPYSPERIRSSAMRFSRQAFRRNIAEAVGGLM